MTRQELREELERVGRDLEQRLIIRMVTALGVFVTASTLVVHYWK
jgi:hypothetical protein